MRYQLLTAAIVAFLSISHGSCQTVKPYSGRLDCNYLNQDIANFSRLLVGRYCKGASEACEIQKMYEKLDKNHPLAEILKDRLQDYLNLQLEICELAIMVNAPEFYEKNYSRTNPHASPSSFDRIETISPSTIE